MSIPDVGAITASSYVAAIGDPANFKKSRSVGAWFGLMTRRYQSGEVDYDGHISRRGDAHMRGLLHEAAMVLLTRTRTRGDSDLRILGLALREKLGFKRAAIAVARKLAVIMHAMLKSGELINKTAAALPIPPVAPVIRHNETSLPGRGANHSVQTVAPSGSARRVRFGHWKAHPCEAPIMRRPVSTAKTTVLLAYELTAEMTCVTNRYQTAVSNEIGTTASPCSPFASRHIVRPSH